MKVQPMYLDSEVDEVYVEHTCDNNDEFFVKMIKPKNSKYLLYLSDSSLLCPICKGAAHKTPTEFIRV